MKAIYWDQANMGVTHEYQDIPAEYADKAQEYREALVEAAAEASDEMMEVYLETGDLSEQQIIDGIRKLTINIEIIPMFCGSAFKNKGVQCVLDGVINYLPSPVDVPAIHGADEYAEETRQASSDAPFSALAFKIATDPFVGNLTFIRVYSGSLKTGDTVYNSLKQKKERIGRMVQMHSNSRKEIKEQSRHCCCWVEASFYR